MKRMTTMDGNDLRAIAQAVQEAEQAYEIYGEAAARAAWAFGPDLMRIIRDGRRWDRALHARRKAHREADEG